MSLPAPTIRPRSLWPAFGLGLAVAVGNGLARFSYALLLPAMRDDLGWTYAQAGWMNTANALGYVVGAIAGYWLLHRHSPARLFTVGLWLTVFTLLSTGFDDRIAWLTAARVLSGIGAAWVFSCGGALVVAGYADSPARRSTATGLFFAGAGIGIALAGLLVNPFLAYEGIRGWRQSWMLLGALSAGLSAWPLWEVRSAATAASNAPSGPLMLRGQLGSLLGYFAFAAGYIVYMTFILAWMRDQGQSWQVGTLVWVVLGVSVSLSPFMWRRVLERWNPVFVLSVSCSVTLAGTAIPLLDAGIATLTMSAALFGLGVFIVPTAIAALIRKTMPSAQIAKGMAAFTAVFAIGQAIGPVAAGWIADVGGLNNSLLFAALLLLAAATLPLVGLWLNRPNSQEPTPVRDRPLEGDR